MNEDLYANTNSRHYLRISGVYFQRIDGVGWTTCPDHAVPDLAKFWPLHEKQWAVYKPALEEAGLL